MSASLEQALDRLADQRGCRLQEVEIPGFEQAEPTNWTFLALNAAKRYAATIERQRELYTNEFQELVEKGKQLTSVKIDEANAFRTRFRVAVGKVLQQVDVLVMPTMQLPVGRSASGFFTASFNLANCPALSIPCGFLHDGTPIGMQFIAAPNRDGLLLSLARMYETLTDWHTRRPPPYADVW